MNPTILSRLISQKGLRHWHYIGGTVVLVLALGCVSLIYSQQAVQPKSAAAVGVQARSVPLASETASSPTTPIPAAEFSRMIQEFSEAGGFFHSDNFTSNETSYLHIVGKLRELGISGGAYLGVGPEQNFTYIAKIRPRIVFLVDIRRQAIIQHLLYKAIFHQAENRAQFLSLLFSVPLPATALDLNAQPPQQGSSKDTLSAGVEPARSRRAGVDSRTADGSKAEERTVDPLEQLLNYIRETPSSRETFVSNLATVRKTIEENFHFPLSPDDVQSLGYVYSSFWRANLRIGFRFGNGMYNYGSWGFPNLADLILATDLDGKRGNFLANEEDYEFVRKLQEQNRVIPVVGDFAGTKALAAVGNYLGKNGYTVSAFYTSNVEEFLYDNQVFSAFADNIRKLPISNRSVFIRAVRAGWSLNDHPAYMPGDRMTPLLQRLSVFLDDYQQGLLPDYWSLVTTHYIAGTEPRKEAAPTHSQ